MNVCTDVDFLRRVREPHFGGLLKGDAHHIAVLTYNVVRDYATGDIPSGKPNVRLTLAAGNSLASPGNAIGMALMDAGLLTGDMAMGLEGLLIAEHVASELQLKVEEQSAAQIRSDSSAALTVFIYAGISARETAMRTLTRIKGALPHARCHVVTCNCNTPEQFAPHVPLIETLIISQECGGYNVIADIIRAAQAAS